MSSSGCSQEYEKELKKRHAGKIPENTDSSFIIDKGVPDRRFLEINKKLKDFPLSEDPSKYFLHDFGDGLGEVYAYYWKNDPGQGIISYWTQFDYDQNITISKGSEVSSLSRLFAKQGSIDISKSKVISTEIWSKGSVVINKTQLTECYIHGSVELNELSIPEKNRFYTQSCTLNKCSITGNNLFYQDQIYQGTISIQPGATISEKNEIIGNVTVESGVSITGQNRIAGTVTLQSGVTISGETHIDSGPSGSITIQSGTKVSDKATIINSPVIGPSCKLSDSCFICDRATLGANVIVSDNAVVADQAQIDPGVQIKDYAICNMKCVVGSGSQVKGHGIVTGSAQILGAQILDYGFVGGEGTVKQGGIVSGNGRVFDGVTCTHSVSGSKRHWDNRSCKCQIDDEILIDERYVNTPCTPPKYQCPPSIC